MFKTPAGRAHFDSPCTGRRKTCPPGTGSGGRLAWLLLEAGRARRRARRRVAENPIVAEREGRSRNRLAVESNVRIGKRHRSAVLQASAVEGEHGTVDRHLATGIRLDADPIVGELRVVDPDVVAAADRDANAVSF